MFIYSTEEFKNEFEKLIKNNSYRDLEKEIIEYFFDKNIQDLCSGTRLNNSNDAPYIKKRLNGKGGYRVYFYLILKDDCLYLMFVHPKTGSEGSDNISNESKALLYKKVLECVKRNTPFYKIELQVFENIQKLKFILITQESD
ncbi:hypothetical protein SAMN04515674_104225 [Pseudarcicella hirudinis]|uniref:Uncharacterized protein n=1 Tax=Pseudarcicella hirudinis TaxID=1079859 RepID=A0A1I5RSG6_9BACT|nr:hypothetical protein [Pseudarcicella hirudinis]SFP61519.1 hypothetical protein SAMN04515674_104225 [Pseudarcicella hirudinis]